ncbi:MAG TPA: YqgE/AlgH family protein [Rhodospirillales bacterium]|jgi:putative transcriptional regulator|nr:YqgE/AlgH family protein [Rhodospirillaceae bacterium]HHZ75354.1 YqgE/AlgH family protein [Rhodospirillales bacterium]HIA82529.1 YqgE/AlgH family protein [Rhodospirillales bacterium]HIC60879.1 YqgE/AlgH family protein [Rhodospirillales bacterium]HIM19554.1 YqgE/AlgH family protein [Rhodospirillales bacterium]|tara:strand:+ start:1468 stop:2043 length:576 start_codon:yes stop_codon:yes gene_type:complete
MSDISQDGSYVTGQLLIAMPGMRDERFAKSVIYMCAHSEEGAMGLVLNQRLDSLTFAELISQLELDEKHLSRDVPVHFGGPVESGRGFVLHTSDYQQDATLEVVNGVALTATVEILKAIAQGKGPQKSLLALGYAGWGPGQLDMEIRANGWLQVPSDSEIIFDIEPDTKWERAIQRLGIDPRMLSDDVGHA